VSPLGPESRNIRAETEIFPSLARIAFRVQNLIKEIGNSHCAETRNISAEKRKISEEVRTSQKRSGTYLQSPETYL
jgi:hypothetical protein